MSFDYFLGIDPGKTGALVLVGRNRTIEASLIMAPIGDVINWLRLQPMLKTMAIVEKAQAMPKNGAVGMFSYGQGFGELLGAFAALRMPYLCVPPRTWTKTMHQGTPKDLTPKLKSLLAKERLFPGLDLRATPKCKKQHEGLVDALLLAEYGRLSYGTSVLDS